MNTALVTALATFAAANTVAQRNKPVIFSLNEFIFFIIAGFEIFQVNRASDCIPHFMEAKD